MRTVTPQYVLTVTRSSVDLAVGALQEQVGARGVAGANVTGRNSVVAAATIAVMQLRTNDSLAR